tara:strand:+ start:5062 stop:5922 length:861 start_codon:yes stop_codon:yes gene_type:complete
MGYNAIGNGNTGLTEVSVFIPEIWSEYVYDYLQRKLVFRPLVDDYSDMVQGKGDVIHVPLISELTVQSKDENTAISYDTDAGATSDITINQHKYASKLFEDIAVIQANPGMVEKYSEAFGYSLAKEIDAHIASKLITVTSSITTGDDDVITQANMQSALATLGEADLDYRDGELMMAVNPTVYADLLQEDRLVRYDSTGNANGGLITGMVDSMYGMPVMMTNALATAGTEVCGVIFHKTTVGFAMQQGVRMQSDYSIDHLGTKVVADALYGCALIHATRGIRFTND